MYSKVQICNQALLYLGTRKIASFEEPTPEAVYCQEFWDTAVLTVLRDHPWGFAQKREVLTGLEVPPGWKKRYGRAYAYPNDCLQAHYLVGPGEERLQCFEVAADDNRTIILADIPQAVLGYTARLEDVTRFDPTFINALTRQLQCLLTLPVLKTGGRALQEAQQLYAVALSQAKTADAREGRPYHAGDQWWTDNPWARERMGVFRRS